jgi:hypothetical protein
MDTSYWTALNPDIKFQDTLKVTYGHCLYRLSIHAVGASALRQNQNLSDAITWRNNRARDYNWGGSWRKKLVTKEDADLLALIKEQIDYNEMYARIPKNGIKVRIEEPNIHFYSRHELPLRGIAAKLSCRDNSHFVSLMRPASPEHEQIILDGFTIRKNKIEWPYRIIMRDGRYDESSKKQISNYLKALGDQIKVPRGLWEQLEKGGWIWGGYIYVHDRNLSTMLSLIDSRVVSRVEEFKSADTTE